MSPKSRSKKRKVLDVEVKKTKTPKKTPPKGKKKGSSRASSLPTPKADGVKEMHNGEEKVWTTSGGRKYLIPVNRPVRMYADGVFDMFHTGHARALEQAKKAFDNVYLMVGVCTDADTHMYKGRTVMTEPERVEALRHCKWCDEVIPNPPWVVTKPFMDKYQIDFVAHDDLPYADASGQCDDVYQFAKDEGRFYATERTEGVSTSDIILRIIKDYNQYVLRNLKRGYSRKDLNVSWSREKRIFAQEGIRSLGRSANEIRTRLQEGAKKVAVHTNKTVQSIRNGSIVKEAGQVMEDFVGMFVGNFERSYRAVETAVKSSMQRVASTQALPFMKRKRVDPHSEEWQDGTSDGGEESGEDFMDADDDEAGLET